MIQGLYKAASGMVVIETRQSVVANNIANSATSGFRRQEPVQKGFYEVFSNKLVRPTRFNRSTAPGGGVKLEETFTDTASGPITVTEDPMNVALSGPGFFVVETPQGQRYTRNGAFAIDIDGQLTTKDGFKVLGADGNPIDAAGPNLQIASDGRVYVDRVPTGQLQLVEFENPHMLTREGNNFFVASEAAIQESAPSENTTVTHKALEASNVALPREMITMLLGLRAYEANQRVINTIDETMQRAVQDVGMPA